MRECAANVSVLSLSPISLGMPNAQRGGRGVTLDFALSIMASVR